MISAIQKSNPAGTSLLRSFRFEGLEVGHSVPPPPRGSPAPCAVLLALDFGGAEGETLAARLAGARRRLAADGLLLLALPNRFGLRFWSGCPEPATGRLFTTLAGTPAAAAAEAEAAHRPGGFVSRRELSEGLAEAGFTPLEWFFAVPDAAETGESGTLISERLVAAAPGLAAELATAQPSADRLRPRLDLFPESLVARELARAGLFAEFANYFLVAAAAGDGGTAIWPRVRPPAPEVAWHFAAWRREPIATRFELEPAGIAVSKSREAGAPADDRQPQAAGGYRWAAPARGPLAPGEPLRLRLQEALVAGRGEAFLAELAAFCVAVRERFEAGDHLAGEALDATVTNATRDAQGAFHLFDLEWSAPAGLPLSWWILRNVLACRALRGPRLADVATGSDLYAQLCRLVGVAPRLADDLAREAEFGAAVRGTAPESAAVALASALAEPWPAPVALGLEPAALRSALEVTAAHEQLVASYRRLELWAEEAQRARAAAEAAYQRLEGWAEDVQQANTTLLADYRKLAQRAADLEAQLQQRHPGAGP